MSIDINKMIDEAIDQLSDDRVDSGVEALYELAILWRSSGASRESWVDICQYIEREATEKSDETFIQIKIGNALTKIRETKTGSVIWRPLH